MQTIYIDTLICINLFIDYLILCITKMILHINAKNSRLLLSALFGAITTLTATIPFQSVLLSALLKITYTMIMILIAFGKGDFRKIILRFLMFLGISMILSVSVVAINLIYKPTGVFIYNDQIYLDISPTVLIIATAVTYIIISMYHKLSNRSKLMCRIYKVTISVADNDISFESALDTGCNLTEPFSGLPVILTDEVLLCDISVSENKMRAIPYTTAAGSDIIYGFKPECIRIDGKKIHSGCYVGICHKKIHGEVKSILGPRVVEAL